MIYIKVPATSANIGAGFDCMGLAVDIYNEVWVEKTDKGLVIETDADLPKDKSNLVFRALSDAMKYIRNLRGNNTESAFLSDYIRNPQIIFNLKIRQKNNIPKASGLGSSAACIAAGVLIADALCGNILTENEIINIATSLDGHPDNVVPALIGGITAAVFENGKVNYLKVNLPAKYNLTFFTPSFPLATHKARAVLPPKYKREDAVYNISHAVLTFAALVKGEFGLLKSVVGDRIHEPYRKGLINSFDDVCRFAAESGALAVYLSGAGPTVAAFTDKNFDKQKMQYNLGFLPDKWTIHETKVLETGAIAIEI